VISHLCLAGRSLRGRIDRIRPVIFVHPPAGNSTSTVIRRSLSRATAQRNASVRSKVRNLLVVCFTWIEINENSKRAPPRCAMARLQQGKSSIERCGRYAHASDQPTEQKRSHGPTSGCAAPSTAGCMQHLGHFLTRLKLISDPATAQNKSSH
jgi:hypothetical protein